MARAQLGGPGGVGTAPEDGHGGRGQWGPRGSGCATGLGASLTQRGAAPEPGCLSPKFPTTATPAF